MSAPLSAAERATRAAVLAQLDRHAEGAAHQLEALPPPVEQPDIAPPPCHPPVVTITITGAPGSGKTVIAHAIRQALGYEGIACDGPADLRSVEWRRAVRNLIGRGIRVRMVRGETQEG